MTAQQAAHLRLISSLPVRTVEAKKRSEKYVPTQSKIRTALEPLKVGSEGVVYNTNRSAVWEAAKRLGMKLKMKSDKGRIFVERIA